MACDRGEPDGFVSDLSCFYKLGVVLKLALGLVAIKLSDDNPIRTLKAIPVDALRHESPLDVHAVPRQNRLGTFLVLCEAVRITNPKKPHCIEPILTHALPLTWVVSGALSRR